MAFLPEAGSVLFAKMNLKVDKFFEFKTGCV